MSKILHWWRQWRCAHEFAINATVAIEDWQPPEPHPNPHFADRVQIQRQRVIGGGVCSKCGKVVVQIGHNQRDLPGKGNNLVEVDFKRDA